MISIKKKIFSYQLYSTSPFTTNSTDVAELFDKYFNDIEKNLAGKIKSSNPNTHKHYFDKSVSDSFFLNPTTPAEICNVISSLKNTKSSGYDKITVFFLKAATKVLATPLSYLFSFSF